MKKLLLLSLLTSSFMFANNTKKKNETNKDVKTNTGVECTVKINGDTYTGTCGTCGSVSQCKSTLTKKLTTSLQ